MPSYLCESCNKLNEKKRILIAVKNYDRKRSDLWRDCMGSDKNFKFLLLFNQ